MATLVVVILLSTVAVQAAPDPGGTQGQVVLRLRPDATQRTELERPLAVAEAEPEPEPERPTRKWLWIGLGIAGGALVVAGVTIGIVYGVPANAADHPGTAGTTVIRFP